MTNKKDAQYMRQALLLAEARGKYVSPNPKVGAVLVKGERVIGSGGHSRYGGPHAEIIALREAGPKARGATLYVTLEPCSHYGKTPPCAEALIRAGIKRVVCAMKDPFPLVRGLGFRKLINAGVRIEVGLFGKEAAHLNEPFLFSATHGRPWVLLKAALSLDGKIARWGSGPRWITGPQARRRAHELRSRMDAILVGRKTVQDDNPSLTVRLPGYHRQDGWPMRVILDSRLECGPELEIFKGAPQTIVFASDRASRSREKTLVKKGVGVFRVPFSGKMLSLKAVLGVLSSLQVRSLMVEGGGEVHASFLKERLADEAALFISPENLGHQSRPWVGGGGVVNANGAPWLKDLRVERIGNDFLMTGKI